MELSLNKAYNDVLTSSKEIIKNKQRHLYCNMMDLLTRTCKTLGNDSSRKVNGDDNDDNEQVRFWLCDILPLVFDEQLPIQNSAITALDYGLKALSVASIQGSVHWSDIKSTLLTSYVPKIHKLREARNSNWCKVWAMLIRVLDKEILRGSSTINIFLSIVELGFRSADYAVRAEAFLCWRQLIEIFAQHQEMNSPKRIKLICIPLKSSQPKTANVAEIKLSVWWFLICKIEPLAPHFTSVVEPFLHFCYGAHARHLPNTAKQYETLKEMAQLCLASLLQTEPQHVDYVERSLRNLQLTPLPTVDCLAVQQLLAQHWQPLIFAVSEAIKLMHLQRDDDYTMAQLLLKGLMQPALQLQRSDIFDYLYEVLLQLPPQQQSKCAISVLNMLASNNSSSSAQTAKISNIEDLANFGAVLAAHTRFFVASRSKVPKAILQSCIDNIYALPRASTSGAAPQWRLLHAALNVILQSGDDEDFNAFETKLLIWQTLSADVLRHSEGAQLDYRLKEKADVLHAWLLWPLRVYAAFAGKHCAASNDAAAPFDANICNRWALLLDSAQHAYGRATMLEDLARILGDILQARKNIANFALLFEAYARACSKQSVPHTALFELLATMLAQPLPAAVLEACLHSMHPVVDTLDASAWDALIEPLKQMLATLLKSAAQRHIAKPVCEELKRLLLEKSKTLQNKNHNKQLRLLLRKDNNGNETGDGGASDDFVVIPSVWSLNPDKLTERQKEKYAEQAVIPALYNDMSQSQESSIKPWTPKKIVLQQEAAVAVTEALHTAEALAKSVVDENVYEFSDTAPSTHEPEVTLKHIELRYEMDSPLAPKQQSHLRPLTEQDEELLRKFDVQITDDSKRRTILNNLLKLDIDTVDGDSYRMGGNCGRAKRRSAVRAYNQMLEPKTTTTTDSEMEDVEVLDEEEEELVKEFEEQKKKKKVLEEQKQLEQEKKLKLEEEQQKLEIMEKKKREDQKRQQAENDRKLEEQKQKKQEEEKKKQEEEKRKQEAEMQKQKEEKRKEEQEEQRRIEDENRKQEEEKKKQEEKRLDDEKKKLAMELKKQQEEEEQLEAEKKKLNLKRKKDEEDALMLTNKQPIKISPKKMREMTLRTVPTTAVEIIDLETTSTNPESAMTKDEDAAESTTLPITSELSIVLPELAAIAATKQLSSPKRPPVNAAKSVLLLSSPPDRNHTNNSISPHIKPKPASHLTGRGAQLINMIRSKRGGDTASGAVVGASSAVFSHSPLAIKSFENAAAKCDNRANANNNKNDLAISGEVNALPPYDDHTSTPMQSKDLLTFSKMLPSPTASPSASILKRKLRCDSLDDLNVDSPALKRKRVSFHDPPVSVTKEYITDVDENKSKPKRCLVLERSAGQLQNLQQLSGKHIIKRKSKFESISELERYATNASAASSSTNLTANAAAAAPTTPIAVVASTTTTSSSTTSSASASTSTSSSNSELLAATCSLDNITQRFTLDEVLEKYVANDQALSLKSANTLAKFLSHNMRANDKIKVSVMESLSENHSKEFLDHAVQENLSSVVCDRLNLNSVIDYVCEKSKINSVCRQNLLCSLPEIFKQQPKLDAERLEFIRNLLSIGANFSDDNVFSLINMLIQKRMTSAALSNAVSEPAIDSSSSL